MCRISTVPALVQAGWWLVARGWLSDTSLLGWVLRGDENRRECAQGSTQSVCASAVDRWGASCMCLLW